MRREWNFRANLARLWSAWLLVKPARRRLPELGTKTNLVPLVRGIRKAEVVSDCRAPFDIDALLPVCTWTRTAQRLGPCQAHGMEWEW